MTFLGALLLILGVILCSLAVTLMVVTFDLSVEGEGASAVLSLLMVFAFGGTGMWIITNLSDWGMWW